MLSAAREHRHRLVGLRRSRPVDDGFVISSRQRRTLRKPRLYWPQRRPEQVPTGQDTASRTRNGWQSGWQYTSVLKSLQAPQHPAHHNRNPRPTHSPALLPNERRQAHPHLPAPPSTALLPHVHGTESRDHHARRCAVPGPRSVPSLTDLTLLPDAAHSRPFWMHISTRTVRLQVRHPALPTPTDRQLRSSPTPVCDGFPVEAHRVETLLA